MEVRVLLRKQCRRWMLEGLADSSAEAAARGVWARGVVRLMACANANRCALQ